MVRFIDAIEAVRRDGVYARRFLWPAGRRLEWPFANAVAVCRPVSLTYLGTVLAASALPNIEWFLANYRITGGYKLSSADVLATDWQTVKPLPDSTSTDRP
jgi:hypothetical protein